MKDGSIQHIDTLLHARWIIPVDNKHRYLENHAIAIHEDKIVDILPSEQANNRYSADVNRRYQQHALIPGLINSHTHAAMNLFRNYQSGERHFFKQSEHFKKCSFPKKLSRKKLKGSRDSPF